MSQLGEIVDAVGDGWIDWSCSECGTSRKVRPDWEWKVCKACWDAQEEAKRMEFWASANGWARLLKEYRVPERFRRVEPGPLPEAVEPFLSGRVSELAFCGPLGTGKTWQATQVLLEIGRSSHPIRRGIWADVGEALRTIKGEWRTEYDGETMAELCAVPILLLDDLGAEPSYEYAQADLSHILRTRYNHERPTIVTCQSLDDLEGRLASRLAGGVVIRKGGDDRRVT